jgi:hypothetical protein
VPATPTDEEWLSRTPEEVEDFVRVKELLREGQSEEAIKKRLKEPGGLSLRPGEHTDPNARAWQREIERKRAARLAPPSDPDPRYSVRVDVMRLSLQGMGLAFLTAALIVMGRRAPSR